MEISYIKDKTVYTGRPATSEGRLPKEMAAYDLPDELGIPYTRLDHEAIFTVEGCNEVDKLMEMTMLKFLKT